MDFQIQCPMPKLDFDIITLGHGSGGLLTNRFLEKCIIDLFGNEDLKRRHDGAILPDMGKLAFTTDSFVISPVFFPGGNIGSLAVHGTVNDLAMCGATPRYLSLAFIIEEGLSMAEFWQILVSVKMAAEQAGVRIVTGDTKVVERGKGDKIFVNTTGIGEVHPAADIRSDRINVGDRVIVSNYIAAHGVSILSIRQGLAFESEVISDSRSLHQSVLKGLDRFGGEIHMLRDATRGGIATVLNEICRDARIGIDIKEPHIPVEIQVASACEMLGLDPLYVANEGVFVAIVSPDIADDWVHMMQVEESTRGAAIIGEVVVDHPGQVVLESRVGGRRVVNMLVGEQLPRIC